jgi:GNAT superfamily N-acetyltransferase
MPELTLTAVRVPASADDEDGADFRTLIALRNAHNERIHGDASHTLTPAGALPHWQEQQDWRIDGYLARIDGEVVASGSAEFGMDEGATAGGMNIRVALDRWGEGIGSELVRFLERLVAEEGRATVQTWSEHPESGEERLQAATGFGSIPRDHVARFLVRHGYVLEQVYRNSRLGIEDALERTRALTADARAAADPEYRTISWELPTPDEHLEDFAWMKSRMSTDAPSGDVDVVEEAWDADRVRRLDAKRIGGGFRVFVTVAQHVASARLVAFTELAVDEARPSIAHQEDTLVLAEHRGHRLGLLLKGENLLRLHDLLPDVREVETYNAEENRPMLAINETMGFAPVLYAGEWQKRLD